MKKKQQHEEWEDRQRLGIITQGGAALPLPQSPMRPRSVSLQSRRSIGAPLPNAPPPSSLLESRVRELVQRRVSSQSINMGQVALGDEPVTPTGQAPPPLSTPFEPPVQRPVMSSIGIMVRLDDPPIMVDAWATAELDKRPEMCDATTEPEPEPEPEQEPEPVVTCDAAVQTDPPTPPPSPPPRHDSETQCEILAAPPIQVDEDSPDGAGASARGSLTSLNEWVEIQTPIFPRRAEFHPPSTAERLGGMVRQGVESIRARVNPPDNGDEWVDIPEPSPRK